MWGDQPQRARNVCGTLVRVRRFEFIGGGSEKFWEVGRDGAEVTVRFGRIGTNGQTQTKDLGSDGAAIAHLDKLVAEKVKKGYVEGVGTATATSLPTRASKPSAAPKPITTDEVPPAGSPDAAEFDVPPLPDETTFTLPGAWARQAEVFRGLRTAPKLTLDPERSTAKASDLHRAHHEQVRRILDHPTSDAELVNQANLHLGRTSGFLRRAKQADNPVGAAVLTAVLSQSIRWDQRDQATVLADDLFIRYGAPFAAEALARVASIVVVTSYGNQRGPGVQPPQQWIVNAQPGQQVHSYGVDPLLRRARAILTAVDDGTYRDVVQRLAGIRQGPLNSRVVASYLAPTEQAWVDDDIAALQSTQQPPGAGGHVARLLASATTLGQVQAVLAITPLWIVAHETELLYSIISNLGVDALSPLISLFDSNLDAATQKRLLNMISGIPTDAAFNALLDRADQKYVAPVLIEVTGRYPVRALRLLAQRSTGSNTVARRSKELLRGHLISNPTLVSRADAELDPEVRHVLDSIRASAAVAPPAAAADLPEILRTPPWERKGRTSKATVIPGLEPPPGLSLQWKPGERDEWASLPVNAYIVQNFGKDWKAAVKQVTDPASGHWGALNVLAAAPPNIVRPYLARYTPQHAYDALPALRRILAGVGEEALDFTVRVVAMRPTTLAPALLPIEGAEVAGRMAEWLNRSKSLRPVAREWLARHPRSAAIGLIPASLGKAGKNRAAAETALRVLDQAGERSTILEAAARYGDQAHVAVKEALDIDPLERLPAKMPALPAWLDPAHLPAVLLRGREQSVPPEAVGHICSMFALCKPGETYAGVELVKEATDPASLAEMGWGLLERWQDAGFPSKEAWVLEALGLVGDDETVRRLAPLIRTWPGDGGHARAVAALDVLSAIGTDVALMHLYAIAEKAKFKALKTKASEKIDEVADDLGLSTDQLADRLVPDFGLDDQGSMVLDYGPRRFTVAFDEQLKPIIADEDGSRRKVLPKPSARDDQDLAAASYAAFSGLKKDVKVVATDQIRRFERAMVLGRRWVAHEHRTFFIDHPLLWHLTRRLVWATFDSKGAVTGSFRVAEDRTLASVEDNEVAVADDATIGIAHPLHLGGHLEPWSEVFADYEILQPFAQLGRDVWQLTPEERNARVLRRMDGLTIDTGRILGLSHRGWDRGPVLDGGVTGVVQKPIGNGRFLVIDLDPGIIAGAAMEWKEQKITGVWISDGPVDYGNGSGNRLFAELDAISASELIRDLEHLRG